MASPMAPEIAMERVSPIAFSEMAPALNSVTCLFKTWTAGSALMINQPISIARGTRIQLILLSAMAPPRT